MNWSYFPLKRDHSPERCLHNVCRGLNKKQVKWLSSMMLKCTGTCNFISFFGLFCGQQWDRLYKGWISHQRNSIISVLKIMYNKLSTSINIGYIYGTLLPDKRTLQWDTSSTWDSKSQPKKSKHQTQHTLIRNHPSIITCIWQSKNWNWNFLALNSQVLPY